MEITLSKSLLIAVVLAPLVGSVIAGLFGRQVGRRGAQFATILGVAVSCALSIIEVIRALPGLELAGLVEATGAGYRRTRAPS